MTSTLFTHLYARPELFKKEQPVFLRKPEEETDDASRKALAHLLELIGRGPFRVLRIMDTPSSKAAPQCITLANPGSDTPLGDQDGALMLSGYYLTSDSQ